MLIIPTRSVSEGIAPEASLIIPTRSVSEGIAPEASLINTNPKRQRGDRPGSLADASGWYQWTSLPTRV